MTMRSVVTNIPASFALPLDLVLRVQMALERNYYRAPDCGGLIRYLRLGRNLLFTLMLSQHPIGQPLDAVG